MAARNLVWPNYNGESIARTVMWVLRQLGLNRDEEATFMLVQYFSVLIMGVIIALNVNSFMQNLLVTLKSLLRDMTLIKTNYDINILIFAFVSLITHTFFLGHGHILPPDDSAAKHEPGSGGSRGL